MTWWKDGQLLRRSQETVSLCATCPFIKVILNNLHVRQKTRVFRNPLVTPWVGIIFNQQIDGHTTFSMKLIVIALGVTILSDRYYSGAVVVAPNLVASC